ncbi:hypothetical protein MACH18_28510 [Phaeobacter italicus]|nr:hypothetical protein MACH18_28510 [Phaeobacter italicus]
MRELKAFHELAFCRIGLNLDLLEIQHNPLPVGRKGLRNVRAEVSPKSRQRRAKACLGLFRLGKAPKCALKEGACSHSAFSCRQQGQQSLMLRAEEDTFSVWEKDAECAELTYLQMICHVPNPLLEAMQSDPETPHPD